jgi:hypothetical protein
MTDLRHCSNHWLCRGPTPIPEHSKVCDAGADCDDDMHWTPCRFCTASIEPQVPAAHGFEPSKPER